ncbi:AAA family ATPase [Lacisediminihabitans sp. H27-G8]|uniref:AAA family ATPase n=1 Tax=Lacisediminihabitans sp. H27-G8 TaxID=3111909 RepID=UPI0038FC4541
MREVLDAIAVIGIDRTKVIKTRSKAEPAFELPEPLEDQNKPFEWHDPFMQGRYPDQMEWLQVARGLTLGSIEQRRIGYDSQRYTFPIRYRGKWRNVRRYLPGGDPKWLQLPGHGAALLYPTEVLAGNTDPVLLCEGELDAILAQQQSEGLFVAVTGTGGAGVAPKDLSPLAGREVFVAYDLDDPGRKGAAKILPLLIAAGAVARIIDLESLGLSADPGDKSAPDITDFFMLGGTAEILHTEMVRLREAVPEEVAKNSVLAKATSSGNSGTSSGVTRAVLRRASEIKSRLQKFLWRPRLPLGTLSLFAGRGGVGKSTFAIWVAVEAQHGRLPGDLLGEKMTVLYVSVEDHWETQMVPRLVAAGADLDRFYKLDIEYTEDNVTHERIPNLPEDTQLIKEKIIESGARLVIIDPITSTISGDDHKREVVRAVLDPLAQIAGETDSVIIGIMHFNKGIGNASDKLSGSHAYRDTARSVLLFARDEDSDQIVMSQDKTNYAEADDQSLAYRLVDTAVDLDDGNIGRVARVEIIGNVSTSVNQIINRPQGQDSDVVQWLNEFMAEMGAPVAAQVVLDTGAAEGFTKTQLTRARKRAHPTVVTRKTGMDGGWEWSYEEIARPEEIPEIPEEVGILNGEFFATSSAEAPTTETESGDVEK